MWDEVLARFEKQAPVSVMARITLEQAMPAAWIDDIFETNRQRQYPRELLFCTIVELMSLVCLGLRPSLHAAARKMENLPVTLAVLYDKINRTELPLLRALVPTRTLCGGPLMRTTPACFLPPVKRYNCSRRFCPGSTRGAGCADDWCRFGLSTPQ